MKKLFFIALSAMFCLGSAAQNEIDDFVEVPDTISGDMTNEVPVDQNSMFTMAQGISPIPLDAGPLKEQLHPLGKGIFKHHLIEQAIELCPNITKSKPSQADKLLVGDAGEIDDTGISLDFGYSVIFTPGHEENGKLKLNKMGVAYSLGVNFSFTKSDRYGTLCDFMAKIGVETCHNRKMGIGLDLLAGYGKSAGDFFIYQNTLLEGEPTSICPYAEWGAKYGAQVWIKTGVLGKALSNTDVLLFARLIKAPEPSDIKTFSLYTYNLWRVENWSFGVILRYRI